MTFALSSARPTRRRENGVTPMASYLAVWRQRRELARLSDTMLCDLGISRAQAAREAARPIWDIAPK